MHWHENKKGIGAVVLDSLLYFEKMKYSTFLLKLVASARVRRSKYESKRIDNIYNQLLAIKGSAKWPELRC